MTKTLLALCVFAAATCAATAQSNSFPSSGNVGIGTANPGAPLEVQGNAQGVSIQLGLRNLYQNDGGGSAVGVGFLNESNGAWWKAAVVHERTGGYGIGKLHFLVSNQTDVSPVDLNSARLTITPAGNVGIGTVNPSDKLTVNGVIRAKEIIVDTGWADYVFEDSYRLLPLSEVEQHIKQQKHLPGVPSAQEMTENGAKVGDVQALLLAKIEELTLHIIQQEKRIRQLEQRDAKAVNTP